MKYGIVLYSKHTGECVFLGSEYNSREEAKKFVDTEVCSRCNRIEIVHHSDTCIYQGRKIGFVEKKLIEPTGIYQRSDANLKNDLRDALEKVSREWRKRKEQKQKSAMEEIAILED